MDDDDTQVCMYVYIYIHYTLYMYTHKCLEKGPFSMMCLQKEHERLTTFQLNLNVGSALT